MNHITYRGYYRDEETGFYYLQSRYYDPEICRFVNADDVSVIEVSLSSMFKDNLYCYCNGNPVNFIDNDGRLAQVLIGAAMVAVTTVLLYWVEWKLKMRKWSWLSLTIQVVANAAMGAFTGGMVGNVWTKLFKLSSKATKLGATGTVLKALKLVFNGSKMFINSIIKPMTRKPGESWIKAVRRLLHI